jgi:putative photosynthetic complex assembly protein 2
VNGPLAAVLAVVGAWWLSTALVLALVWLPAWTFRFTLLGASALAVLGLAGLSATSGTADVPSAALAFGCALLVWAWHELSFLLGVVTGPRRQPLSPLARGLQRFGEATRTVIHHEVALAVTAALVVALTWGQPNQVGAWTFLVLWVMRLSAKLNLFLGVRSVNEELIPPRLRYLTSYFHHARMNPLMPFSLALGGLVAVWLLATAWGDGADGFVQVGWTLVGTLLALGLLEHVFLAVPAADVLLWRWALPRAEAPAVAVVPVEAAVPGTPEGASP